MFIKYRRKLQLLGKQFDKVEKGAIHKVGTQGKREGGFYLKVYIHYFGELILLLKYVRGGTGGQTFRLFKRIYSMDGP